MPGEAHKPHHQVGPRGVEGCGGLGAGVHQSAWHMARLVTVAATHCGGPYQGGSTLGACHHGSPPHFPWVPRRCLLRGLPSPPATGGSQATAATTRERATRGGHNAGASRIHAAEAPSLVGHHQETSMPQHRRARTGGATGMAAPGAPRPECASRRTGCLRLRALVLRSSAAWQRVAKCADSATLSRWAGRRLKVRPTRSGSTGPHVWGFRPQNRGAQHPRCEREISCRLLMLCLRRVDSGFLHCLPGVYSPP